MEEVKQSDDYIRQSRVPDYILRRTGLVIDDRFIRSARDRGRFRFKREGRAVFIVKKDLDEWLGASARRLDDK
jgi:hypothetical protein